ncbi:NBR1-Ig-like domain-containing protein [Corynebacterium epidermidicanis]|uniref:Nbr1 FW domain-containing protein n=1 Tax=Corynebacterium epidermidicanis TaxID=1050174 RepID=A0A0G3GTX2_9CORY|nr:NBR1-Ig-like domain-containing protein [Corynebacterium epidermidicanis]AKK02998.1 hypothetical protein CEPID_05665 [Corynebacterium epidermidicanis]
MTTLKELCRAAYRKCDKHKSQGKFAVQLFEACGCTYRFDKSGDYARKICFDARAISDDIRLALPKTGVKTAAVSQFIQLSMESSRGEKQTMQDRLQEVARNLGFPSDVEVESEAFYCAYAHAIKIAVQGLNDQRDVLSLYELHVSEAVDEDDQYWTPLYEGDRVKASQPPALQNNQLDYWELLTHEWVLHNQGSLRWENRTLVCLNPNDRFLRPMDTELIEIPTVEPSKFVRISATFKARGRDGTGTSEWRMLDQRGQDCFPNQRSEFNVQAHIGNNTVLGEGQKA